MDNVYLDPELAASQAEILALFHACRSPLEFLEKVAASGIQEDLKAWLLSCDPDMLETAGELVRQWGSSDPALGIGTPSANSQSANPAIPP